MPVGKTRSEPAVIENVKWLVAGVTPVTNGVWLVLGSLTVARFVAPVPPTPTVKAIVYGFPFDPLPPVAFWMACDGARSCRMMRAVKFVDALPLLTSMTQS